MTDAAQPEPGDARSGGSVSIAFLEGPDAARFLASADAATAWGRLHAGCAWATASQSPAFVRAWYESFADEFAPALVTGTDIRGALVGLLPLAVSRATGAIASAGTIHAEYQTWLADPSAGPGFGAASLALTLSRGRRGGLCLRYVAPGTPVESLRADGSLARRTVTEPMLRALVDVAEASGQAALRKSSNRSRLNRLRKMGELRFERIRDMPEFCRALDELSPMYDLRQGAENDCLPFAGDPRKRPFHEALFAAGLLHATVLRVGDRIAAAHVGVIDRDRVCLGVFAHSPFFARHSPGKLLLHMLVDLLHSEGVATLDMTPGEGWKERFATRTDTVTTLTAYPSSFGARARLARLAAERRAKALALRAGTTPDRVRELISAVRRRGAAGIARSAWARARRLRSWIHEDVEYCIYAMAADRAAAFQPSRGYSVNSISDLLAFRPTHDWQTRQAFLAQCIERLSAGDRVFTFVEDGLLLSWGWLSPGAGHVFNSEVGQELVLPPGSAVAYDFHTHPRGRGRGLHKDALAAALSDAAATPGVATIWTGVLASNGPSRHNCVKMGWEHVLSQWKRTRAGRVTVVGGEVPPSPPRAETSASLARPESERPRLV